MPGKDNFKRNWILLRKKSSQLLSLKDSNNNALLSKSPPSPLSKQEPHNQRCYAYTDQLKNTSSTTLQLNQKNRLYLAYLSNIALEFRQRIVLTDHIKDGIEHKNTFDGKEAVDKIALIVGTSDRKLALRIGKSLSEQRFFHDVSYETKLVDSEFYFYEFSNRSLYIHSNDTPSSSLLDKVTTTATTLVNDEEEEDPFTEDNHQQEGKIHHNIIPSSIITEMTRCYSPTCLDLRPCYSPICPKRLLQFKRNDSSDSFISLPTSIIQKHSKKRKQDYSPNNHDLWADNINKDLYNSITKAEKKRQENIYELIYTEEDYVNSLDYLQTMWIKPLLSQPIIPQPRREEFVSKVFGGISSIYSINKRLLAALLKRQKEYPIVYQIGDILLKYVTKFLPYINYGSKQYEAKFLLENEIFTNSNFDLFVRKTESHPRSLKLELNGYLTKPTTRLGRYTLLFKEILKQTPLDHPDQQNITKAIEIIKQLLSKVNSDAGQAKNTFDLQRIHQNLSFKLKTDQVNLNLLSSDRIIIKQGLWKKTPQADSVEYQVILLDNYLLVAKIKIANGVERYVIQKKPIPIELLSIQIPNLLIDSKRSSTRLLNPTPTNSSALLPRAATDIGPQTSSSQSLLGNNNKPSFFPLTFQYLGGHNESKLFTLYTSSFLIRKQWIEKIREQQTEKDKKNTIFELLPVLGSHLLSKDIRMNHFITFGGGRQYLFSTDDGVYVGHHNCKADQAKVPQKILDLYNVTQIEVIEKTQTLLVLADRVLWEYPLEVVNGTPTSQSPGYRLQSNVPFFHVGTSAHQTLLCIPRISSLRSIISIYEPRRKIDPQLVLKKQKNIFEQLRLQKQKKPSEHKSFKKLKDVYVPCEAYKVELTPSMILVTTSRGVVMVDIRTDQPQQLLNPNDPSLEFLLEKEREPAGLNLRQPIKSISIFKTPQNHHFLCYDGYGLFIDRKGNRLFPDFLIEWEGVPESFAFSYPYVMVFDPSFIEIRNIHTGAIEQIIRGKNIKCLNNGHKTELPLVFASMTDPAIDSCQFVFSLNLIRQESKHNPNT